MKVYRSQADLAEAISGLIALEPRFAVVHERHGLPSLRQGPAALEGLLMIVTEQFLSLQAAAAIWMRLRAVLEPFTAETILAQGEARLLTLGLSRAKARTFLAAAAADLDFDRLHDHDDEALRLALCALPGIGPWTADIYLLSSLQRTDVFPAGDLALQHAAHHLFDLGARPTPRALTTLAEAWRPHRAAAARLLWAHYRALRGLSQA